MSVKPEPTLEGLLNTKRWCYTIPEATGFIAGRGWRVSIAIEGIEGHYPTGDLNFDDTANHVEPWFWGGPEDPYAYAEQICAEQNQLLGYDATEVWKIILSTLGKSPRKTSPVFRRRSKRVEP